MKRMLSILALVLSAGSLLGTDPKVIPAGEYVDFKVDNPKNGVVRWTISPEPVQQSTVENARLIFAGKAGSTYNVTASIIVIDFDKKTFDISDVKLKFQFEGAPVVVTPPPKDPPVVGSSLYFMIVRADGPASPSFTKAVGLGEWDVLRKDGHKVKDFTLAESKTYITLPANTTLPAVAVLKEGATTSDLLRVVPLPTTGAGVLDLPK